MCEYDPECTKSDNKQAVSLWKGAGIKAALTVYCPGGRHPLGRVFDVPDRGLMLCTRMVKFRRRDLYVEPANPLAIEHFHAALVPISDYAPGQLQIGRCACGTWTYTPGKVQWVLDNWPNRITAGPSTHKYRNQPYLIGGYTKTAWHAAAARREAP